jgi:hypothetical protein
MSTEALLWGVIPTGIALSSSALSIACAAKRRKPFQVLASCAVILCTVFSLWLVKRIFIDGAWPIYLSHFLVAAAALIAALQKRSVSFQKKNA